MIFFFLNSSNLYNTTAISIRTKSGSIHLNKTDGAAISVEKSGSEFGTGGLQNYIQNFRRRTIFQQVKHLQKKSHEFIVRHFSQLSSGSNVHFSIKAENIETEHPVFLSVKKKHDND